eukprot:2456950-Pleurochrysis_carterae.AAC.5
MRAEGGGAFRAGLHRRRSVRVRYRAAPRVPLRPWLRGRRGAPRFPCRRARRRRRRAAARGARRRARGARPYAACGGGAGKRAPASRARRRATRSLGGGRGYEGGGGGAECALVAAWAGQFLRSCCVLWRKGVMRAREGLSLIHISEPTRRTPI